jgi:hypothetical protein
MTNWKDQESADTPAWLDRRDLLRPDEIERLRSWAKESIAKARKAFRDDPPVGR